MVVKFFEKLSTDYLDLLDDKEDFNVIINAGESPNTKIFQAHSNVLRYRSLYFRNELAKTKTNNNVKTINIRHVSIQQFENIIKYIYGGFILIENQETSFIFELMLIASEFLLEELTKYLETHLIETKTNWLRLHFKSIYQKSFQNEQLQELQKWCNDFLVKYPDKIFDSEDFTLLQENALVSLIKRDELQIKEVKIWNYVIKWGIAQNQNLPTNPKNWTKENFLILKTILQNCLPHIRYFQISGDDVIDNIKPYHQILDENLWDDILKRAINPNRQISSIILSPRIILEKKLPLRESFSTIINKEHAAEITTWVDKKAEAYSVKNNPYEFKLLLRGTRDGFTAETFWNLCDKQANTIVVVKVKDTDEILGGYNPVKWDKSIEGHVYCNDSFIFSLKNGIINSTTLSHLKNPEHAIYCYPEYGPCFDDDFWMTAIDNYWTCCITSYEKAIRNIIGESEFSTSEYEVFQIQKK